MTIENLHNEKDLLFRVSLADEQAFQQLIYIYSERVFFHALSFVKSWHQAEEITQDIFLRVWQKRDKLTQVDHWDKYLFTLSRNFLINAMQRKAHNLELGEVEEVEDNLRPDDLHEHKELRLLLERAISQLPDQKQAVFRMIHLDGLSQDQVSRQLGIATRTVRWNLVAALNEIRDFLYRHSINTLYVLLFGLF